MADHFEPLDFIYGGLREHKGSFVMVIIPLRKGKPQRAFVFKGKPKRRLAIGGVYQGSEFSDDAVRGLDSASYKAQWEDDSSIMEWQALHDDAQATVRCLKEEADARKRNLIEEAMLPLRKQYTTLQRQRDSAGLAALEQAVLRALRAPVTKAEQK